MIFQDTQAQYMTSKELEKAIRNYRKETRRLLIEQRSSRNSSAPTPVVRSGNVDINFL
jgi:hypothetical protein